MKDYDNFFLPADDLGIVKEFYEKQLGLEMKFDFTSKGMIAFKVGKNEPSIIFKDRKKFVDVKPTIWFVVDDVTTTYDQLLKKGIEFNSPPFQIPTGMAVEFDDPFGNRLGITDYIKRALEKSR